MNRCRVYLSPAISRNRRRQNLGLNPSRRSSQKIQPVLIVKDKIQIQICYSAAALPPLLPSPPPPPSNDAAAVPICAKQICSSKTDPLLLCLRRRRCRRHHRRRRLRCRRRPTLPLLSPPAPSSKQELFLLCHLCCCQPSRSAASLQLLLLLSPSSDAAAAIYFVKSRCCSPLRKLFPLSDRAVLAICCCHRCWTVTGSNLPCVSAASTALESSLVRFFFPPISPCQPVTSHQPLLPAQKICLNIVRSVITVRSKVTPRPLAGTSLGTLSIGNLLHEIS